MRGIALAAVILMAGWVASAAENEIDEKSLCPVAISVFDGKDSTQMRQFLRFVQNVFDELAARSRENGEPQLKTSLTDTSVEGLVILGYCRQHPTETVYGATSNAYRGLKSLRKHVIDDPVVQPAPKGTSRFR